MGDGEGVALRGGDHETAQEIWMLADFLRTGNQVGGVVIGYAIRGDREDVELEARALSLNDFPTLENPGKIDLFGFQRLHGVNAQGDVLEGAFATRLTNHCADHRRFVGRTKASVDFAVKVARTR